MFRTRSLSLMYCVNLAETSHTSRAMHPYTLKHLDITQDDAEAAQQLASSLKVKNVFNNVYTLSQ